VKIGCVTILIVWYKLGALLWRIRESNGGEGKGKGKGNGKVKKGKNRCSYGKSLVRSCNREPEEKGIED
jgi:hypothetical protein